MKGNGGELERNQYERLVTIMAMLAADDHAGLFMLHAEFGEHFETAVRYELRRLGVRPSSDDFAGIVIDAVLAVGGCASAWDASRGAMPWVWAQHRIRQVVSAFVGQFSDSLDAASENTREMVDVRVAEMPAAAPDSGISEIEVLRRVAAGNDVCALLMAALEDVTSQRDREILLAYKLQASLGDPSPANTVGAAFDLKPATVRQVVKRSLDRLRDLAAREPRFAELANLAFLTGMPGTRTA